jgi:hypothetical protein
MEQYQTAGSKAGYLICLYAVMGVNIVLDNVMWCSFS